MKLFIVGLQLILITLKLTGSIDWSWWAVLSPFGAWFLWILTFVTLHILRYTFDRTYRLRVMLERYASDIEGR